MCASLSPRALQILSMRTHGNEVHATKSARGSTTGNDGGRLYVPPLVGARARRRICSCTRACTYRGVFYAVLSAFAFAALFCFRFENNVFPRFVFLYSTYLEKQNLHTLLLSFGRKLNFIILRYLLFSRNRDIYLYLLRERSTLSPRVILVVELRSPEFIFE